ncbi:MAG: PAS domain S-box protein [Nitrospirae bacterium]|nr:MAG: PAS domain S-box protein [Nitrospirota bacterium]
MSDPVSMSAPAMDAEPSPAPLRLAAPANPNRAQFVMLQTLVTVVLSYQVLFSGDPLLTMESKQTLTLGLLLALGSVMLMPARVMGARWFVGALVSVDTAMTTAIIYWSSDAFTDLYLIYFLIILIAAVTPSLNHHIVLSVLLCMAYGAIQYLVEWQAGVFTESRLLRIPVLLIMAIFYGVAVDTVRKERRKKAGLLETITTLEQAQAVLRESRERYRSLVDNVQDLLCELDQDGRYLYVSQNYAAVLGYEPDGLLGRNAFELVHPDDLAATTAIFSSPDGQGQTVFRYRHQNGEWRWMESTGKAYTTAEGESRGVVISRDITDRKVGEADRESHIILLQHALDNIKTLRGLLPICSHCKKIRDDQGQWHTVETYVKDRTDADFSHGICPDCLNKHYSQF